MPYDIQGYISAAGGKRPGTAVLHTYPTVLFRIKQLGNCKAFFYIRCEVSFTYAIQGSAKQGDKITVKI